MSDLRPETRALLQAGRDGEEPTLRDFHRNRRALARKLGAGAMIASVGVAATTGAAAAGGAGAAGSGALTSAVVSWVVGGALAGTAVVGAVWVHGPKRPVPAIVATAPVASTPRATNIRAVGDPPAEPAPATTAIENVRPAPPPEPRAIVSPRPSRATSPVNMEPQVSPPAGPSSSVGEELDLLRAAEERFHAGAPAMALALLDEHARRFPRGLLAEERRASRILALCQLGRTAAARAEADSFVAQFPTSPFVERVRRACAR